MISGLSLHKLEDSFLKIRHFASRKHPRLGRVKLLVGCKVIKAYRRRYRTEMKGKRAYAHTAHRRGCICTVEEMGDLAKSTIAGVILHEFGHVMAGANEEKADLWVEKNLDIRIWYSPRLLLECIRPQDMRKIFG